MDQDGTSKTALGCDTAPLPPARGGPPVTGSRPRLLDLFCGAGGATRGYQLAGFHVTGVDLHPQPRYVGDEFHQADALTFPLDGFDAIHASPPCQAYTQMSARWRKLEGGKANSHPDLIGPIRERLSAAGVPYIIENVVGAKRQMRSPITISGGTFGLRVHRPRLFESNIALLMPARVGPPGDHIGVYGDRPYGRRLWTRTRLNGDGKKRSHYRAARSTADARAAMGIDWMEWRELAESIPPAYTAYLGKQLIAALSTPQRATRSAR